MRILAVGGMQLSIFAVTVGSCSLLRILAVGGMQLSIFGVTVGSCSLLRIFAVCGKQLSLFVGKEVRFVIRFFMLYSDFFSQQCSLLTEYCKLRTIPATVLKLLTAYFDRNSAPANCILRTTS